MNITSPKTYSSKEREIIKKWCLHPKDTSSVGVEIGLLSHKILTIEEHLLQYQNEEADFSRIRLYLLEIVGKRRKLLNYLKNTDIARYQALKSKIKALS